jgi:hypothetical protein
MLIVTIDDVPAGALSASRRSSSPPGLRNQRSGSITQAVYWITLSSI